MNILRILLVATLLWLLLTGRIFADSSSQGWQLSAAHRIGFVPGGGRTDVPQERKVSIWIYVRNSTDRARPFPTRGYGEVVANKKDHPEIFINLHNIDNPLKESVVLDPTEYGIVQVPPGKSVLILHKTEFSIRRDSELRVVLFIPERIKDLIGIDALTLECDSKYLPD